MRRFTMLFCALAMLTGSALAGCGPETPATSAPPATVTTAPATPTVAPTTAADPWPALTSGCAIVTDAEVAAAFSMSGLANQEMGSSTGPDPVYSCLYAKGSRTVTVTLTVFTGTATAALADASNGYEQATPVTLGDGAVLYTAPTVDVQIALAKVYGNRVRVLTVRVAEPFANLTIANSRTHLIALATNGLARI